MTQDEIIDMAKQAGIEEAYSLKHNQYLVRFKDGSLETFAKLVAEKALAEHAMSEVQRLGQEIEQEPVRLQCVTCGTVYADGVPPLVTQPEQEPVAWMDADGNVSDNNDHKCFPIPLYTTLPQRKPLTDEQIWDAYMKAPVDIDCHVSDLHKFARAIEAAHGIKENT